MPFLFSIKFIKVQFVLIKKAQVTT